jgi:hypothetical protein
MCGLDPEPYLDPPCPPQDPILIEAQALFGRILAKVYGPEPHHGQVDLTGRNDSSPTQTIML